MLIANEILRKCKINGEVQSLKECSDSFFVAVYEGILGESVVGVYTKYKCLFYKSNLLFILFIFKFPYLHKHLAHIDFSCGSETHFLCF